MSKQPNANTINIPALDLTTLARQTATVPHQTNTQSTGGFEMFKEYARDFKENHATSSCSNVWIDDDVKDALEKIRTVVHFPMKHLVSAAVLTFIDQNRDEIMNELSSAKKRKGIL